MDISFESQQDAELYNDTKALARKFGAEQAKRIRKRLDQLFAAERLSVFAGGAFGRCHELKADRKGQLTLDLKHPFRLCFVPANEPIPTKDDGGLDWDKVTAVRIVGVIDPH